MRHSLQFIVGQQLLGQLVRRKQRNYKQEQTWSRGLADAELTFDEVKSAAVLRHLEHGNWGRRNNKTVSRAQN